MGNPQFTSVRWCIENCIDENNVLTVMIPPKNSYVKIDLDNQKIAGFNAEIEEKLSKKSFAKLYEKNPEKWQERASKFIKKKIKEKFGEGNGVILDAEHDGIEVFDAGIADIQDNLDAIEGEGNKVTLNSQNLDCDVYSTLIAMAMVNNCPDKEQDFKIANLTKFDAASNFNFIEGKHIKTFTYPNDGNGIARVRVYDDLS